MLRYTLLKYVRLRFRVIQQTKYTSKVVLSMQTKIMMLHTFVFWNEHDQWNEKSHNDLIGYINTMKRGLATQYSLWIFSLLSKSKVGDQETWIFILRSQVVQQVRGILMFLFHCKFIFINYQPYAIVFSMCFVVFNTDLSCYTKQLYR